MENKKLELAKELLYQLTGERVDEIQCTDLDIVLTFMNKAIDYAHSSTQLPTSTEILSDCKKRFKDLQGKGNLDYRSYQNGYLDSFSKYVVSKIK